MKNLNITAFKLLLPALLFTVIANAQKLPKIQTVSLAAPADIKVDGKTTEWGGKFQAFNRTTEVYYTLSNSATKLYLTVQATERNIIRKITQNGISLTIMPKDKSGTKLVVTYPQYGKKEAPGYFNLRDPYEVGKDTVKNNYLADSVATAYNANINDRFKLIGVIGVASAEDSTLSVFNAEGFKALARFDRKLYYTYELAIPLSYIARSGDAPTSFKYNITINGVPGEVRTVPGGRGNRMVYTAPDGSERNIGGPSPDNMSFAYPSDFSGEYTLAKQ
jgi:hypothetical protein